MALLQPTQREPRSSSDREAERVYFLGQNTSYRDVPYRATRRRVSAPVLSGTRVGGAHIRGGVVQ